MSLIEVNKCSDNNCMIQDKDNNFMIDPNGPPNSECCREVNLTTGQKSKRGLWCAIGSCNERTGLCSLQTTVKCRKHLAKENFHTTEEDGEECSIGVHIAIITLLGVAVFLGIFFILIGMRKK